MSPVHLNIAEDSESLAEKLGYRLEELILHKLDKKPMITLGLSGGSLIELLTLILPRLQLPWPRLRFFFVDERFVPFSSDDSTYGNYQAKLFRQLPITEKNIITIDPTLDTVEQCATDYEMRLQRILNEDETVFDIVLLGMGPDGHVASLFPNHPALNISKGLVTCVRHAPKPPSERVTLTLNALNQATYKIVVVTGESKSTVVKEVLLERNKSYPIAQVNNLAWFLDKAAAGRLLVMRV